MFPRRPLQVGKPAQRGEAGNFSAMRSTSSLGPVCVATGHPVFGPLLLHTRVYTHYILGQAQISGVLMCYHTNAASVPSGLPFLTYPSWTGSPGPEPHQWVMPHLSKGGHELGADRGARCQVCTIHLANNKHLLGNYGVPSTAGR